MKKSKASTKKLAAKAKDEQPVAALVTKAIPKKASVEATKPVVLTPEMTMSEQVGLIAGSIWHYLAGNGATSVAKLVKELSEEEKIIQRSIGWLAQEGKITLDVVNRVETLALKE